MFAPIKPQKQDWLTVGTGQADLCVPCHKGHVMYQSYEDL